MSDKLRLCSDVDVGDLHTRRRARTSTPAVPWQPRNNWQPNDTPPESANQALRAVDQVERCVQNLTSLLGGSPTGESPNAA